MLGIIYLALGSFVGYQLIKLLFPALFSCHTILGEVKDKSNLPNWMTVFPASFLFGTLTITWIAYISAYIFRFTGKSMLYGNITAFLVFTAAAIVLYRAAKKHTGNLKLIPVKSSMWPELLFCILVLSISSFYIFRSFYVKDGSMFTGYSVYSDFGPHLAMIRSFSLGDNFPTGYPHYADGNIRYHFMFQFLAGNLEFLGLRIDWAFNLPSILSLLSFLMLLYSLAVLVTAKRWVGFIAGLMFFFRSSSAFFTYLAGESGIRAGLEKLRTGTAFIGKTSHEDWGLWTFKDYINQRHFAFSMGILILLVLIFYPLVLEMVERLRACKTQTASEQKGKKAFVSGDLKNKSIKWLKTFLLEKEAWLPGSYIRAVGSGLLLGAIGFWHGSIVISALLVLCVLALLSVRRLEYAIVAALTLSLVLLQSSFFAGDSGSVVEPRIVLGFLADRHDLYGIVSYYFELLGVLPVAAAAGVLLSQKGARWLSLAFLTPLVFATTVTLVPDIAINHKYVAVSVILLNIFATYFIYLAFTNKNPVSKASALILIFMLTVTGAANSFTIYNMDSHTVASRLNNPVKEWIQKKTEPHAVFLTSNYVTHPILLAGRKIFNGYEYFAGSAGYDTALRGRITAQIYGSSDASEIKRLLSDNNIDYIVIDSSVRNNQQYKVNEELIRNSFKLVYFYAPEGDLKIYSVR